MARTSLVRPPIEMRFDAGLGNGADAIEADAPRGFKLGLAVGQPDRFGHLVQRHVVEQDHARAGVERRAKLFQRLDFDLDEHVGRRDALRLGQHFGHSASGDDVVFLDQDAVVEADAVVGAAADADRVFLCQPQAGQGLAGVDDLGAGAGHGVDIAAGEGGGAREQLQEVERGAFGGEQRARAGDDVAEGLAGLDTIAILGMPEDGGGRVERLERRVEPVGAAQHGVLAGDDPAARFGGVRNEARRQVAGADVFGQGGGHAALDLYAELLDGFHANVLVCRDVCILSPQTPMAGA